MEGLRKLRIYFSKVRAKRRDIQKAGLAEKTAHKMYRKMVKNAPETIWAAFRVTVPGYVRPDAFIWRTSMPSIVQKDARPATPVSMSVPGWRYSLPFPGRKRILLPDTVMST